MANHWITRNVALVFVTSGSSMIIHNVRMKVLRVEDDGEQRFVGRIERACERERPRNTGDLVGALIAEPGTSALYRGKINWLIEYDPLVHNKQIVRIAAAAEDEDDD